MGTLWTSEKISEYHKFMGPFISGYPDKIDCADLALEGLVEFAFQHGLPIKLKYYSGGKWHHRSSPVYESLDDAKNPALHAAAAQGTAARVAAIFEIMARNVATKDKFKKSVRLDFGAVNVIDNTHKIDPSEALAGDLLMMKRPNGQMGHTRVIHTMVPAFNQVTQEMDYLVIWYQGSVPEIVPTKRTDYLSNLVNAVEPETEAPLVHEGKPRAWNFDAFEK